MAAPSQLKPLNRSNHYLGGKRREMAASSEFFIRTKQSAKYRDSLPVPSLKLHIVELKFAWAGAQPHT